jgi:hypothetical protein
MKPVKPVLDPPLRARVMVDASPFTEAASGGRGNQNWNIMDHGQSVADTQDNCQVCVSTAPPPPAMQLPMSSVSKAVENRSAKMLDREVCRGAAIPTAIPTR